MVGARVCSVICKRQNRYHSYLAESDMSDIPPNEKALPEIKIEEFRARYPQLFSDPRVDEIYCDPGWGGLLLVFCVTL